MAPVNQLRQLIDWRVHAAIDGDARPQQCRKAPTTGVPDVYWPVNNPPREIHASVEVSINAPRLCILTTDTFH